MAIVPLVGTQASMAHRRTQKRDSEQQDDTLRQCPSQAADTRAELHLKEWGAGEGVPKVSGWVGGWVLTPPRPTDPEFWLAPKKNFALMDLRRRRR